MRDIYKESIKLTHDPASLKMHTPEKLENAAKYLRKLMYARRVQRWGRRK